MKHLIVLIMLPLCISAYGQLNGHITDGKEGIPWVHIKWPKGRTVSSADGSFSFPCTDSTQLLKFSAIGFKTKEILINCLEYRKEELIIHLEEDAELLDEVVVSASFSEITRLDAPVPIEVISPKFFKKNPAPSFFESLQNVNGVRPQINCSVCNTGDIHINGMEGPYTLVTIDGMPIIGGLSSVYGLSGIPRYLIERMEIVKGPSSTLFGSEAVGGVINVITKGALNAPAFGWKSMITNWGESTNDIAFRLKKGKLNP